MPVWHFPDKDGELVPVPGGWTLEEFERLWKWWKQLEQPDRQPRYSVQRMSISGTAVAEHAELTIRFWVLVREEDGARVALRLGRAILREPAEYNGPGEGHVYLGEDGEGHVGWIRGGAGKEHQLTLKALVPLERVGRETRLKLRVPRTTVSELKLKVPASKLLGKVTEPARLEPPVLGPDGTTEFTARGLGGEFELTWRTADQPAAELPTVLEAVGAVLARIESHSVDIETTLTVRSYGGAFDRFRVRLPEGAELVPASPSGYTVTPIGESGSDAAKAGSVEVRLAGKTSGPVEVRLAVRQVAKPDQPFEMARFEVVGAARQWGHIAVAVAGDWQVQWTAGNGVRRVDQLPESLRQEDVVAGFNYFAQPCSLSARLVAKQTRVRVEPEYLLLVDADRVRLEAKLKYTVRGAKAFEFEVALPGWEFVDVGPENVVAVDEVKLKNSHVLSIPLRQPSTGQIDLLIRADRPIPEGADSLELSLPDPRADSSGPAAVVVAPADNVELIPNRQLMAGLTRQQVDPQVRPADRQQSKLLFYRSEATEARLGFDFRIHSQRLAVEVASEVKLEERDGSVEQKLVYTIEYEPADHFMVNLPRSLLNSQRLEFEHDGQGLSLQLPENADQEDLPGPVQARVPLSGGCIGLCELLVRYPLSPYDLVPGKRVVLDVPLVMPSVGEGELTDNVLYITAAPTINVEAPQAPWAVSRGDPLRPAQRPGLQLTAEQRTEQVKLTVELEDAQENREGTTVVERAWVQTWLTRSVRQDRAVFSFTSNRRELRLTIPSGAAADGMQVLLDGKAVKGRAAGQAADDRRLIIPLSDDADDHRHVLELGYQFLQRQPRGRMSIEVPRPEADVWVRRMYWQLVLPQNEHVLATPRGLTKEFAWGWNGYYWGRTPLWNEAELEAWAGASTAGRSNLNRANCYLFSTFGTAESFKLHTASRAWIVLIASGGALVAGLLLIYVPASRHPAALLAAAVVALCIGTLYPEPTLLISQAASLGLGLTLLAGLLERTVARRRREALFPEPPSAAPEQGSTHPRYEPPVVGNQASTQNASGPAPPPNPDPPK